MTNFSDIGKLFLLLAVVLLTQQSLHIHASNDSMKQASAQGQMSTTQSRGYQTTPTELIAIKEKADRGVQPYADAVADVLTWAQKPWEYTLDRNESCEDSDRPSWIDNGEGVPVLFAKALSYHLTSEEHYADEVKTILESIMSTVETISVEENRCRLVFGWGIPEVISAADLIEDYWSDMTCQGPLGTEYGDREIGEDNCKYLFQNWLAKNPYFVSSLSAAEAQSNWGASATNALAYIADYLWDRPDIVLQHRMPPELNDGLPLALSPAAAYKLANQMALDRMNGYGVDYHSSQSCDFLSGPQQLGDFPPVKSQITEVGIIPEDARREEFCNIQAYNGEYQNYPQVHLGNNIQQCELMLRRGDSACYDNIDMTDIPNYSFTGPDGETLRTNLYPGRGSIERAINAIIVDSKTEWRHDSALEIAFRYYYYNHQFEGVFYWYSQLDRPSECSQDACFGTLTHGFAPGETVGGPPVVPPPQ